ncbi:MAG: Do family serine endopeptidase [Bacteroidetes bacterium]|nr:Do family serine endopeptidase [Bacteroidota bacterium]
MKNLIPVVTASLLSAILAILGYRYFVEPKEVVIHEAVPARYTSYVDKDDMLSGHTQRKFLSSSPTDFIDAAEAVTPAVVNIKAMQNTNFELWGDNSYSASSGSGVIISSDGYIVTNNHVVEDGEEIHVSLNDKRELNAKLIGTDPSTDLALIKIEDEELPHLNFGNSDSLRVGEWVLAVGNPFNLESTVTAGIVSAKGRSIDILDDQYRIESFIQTDAAVNPGNSGGALVNTNGELVGINTAIITRSGRYEGYSFAVPANLALKVIRDLRDFGEVQRGILGIGIEEVNNRRAKSLELPSVEGIYITRITPKGGADKAGMERGDVIIGVNGAKTSTVPELQEQVGRFRPGDSIKVEYIRDGKKYKTNVTLHNKSNTTELTSYSEDTILKELGFELRNLSSAEKRKLGISGVKVISIYRGSRIERTNMDPGFIITKVDTKKVTNVEILIKELKKIDGKVMLEGVYENYPGEYYYAFPVD